ncbi:DUF6383 domain-containing protein [Parabacteroides johnsonii]|uniref:DUF6383 domain-containing protein n=2 Tax=Parabacteroides johnsonii TaxID=387661 RepID=UPI00242F4D36|nr:DUF6383 domain-containing protein [Parabacteroides johnsonii]
MNKKFTSLAVALMVAGTLSAQPVLGTDLKASDNYYYLKMNNFALSLYGGKADSVIVKSVDESKMTKAQLDSALWKIADLQTVNGVTTFQLRNKATDACLAFAPEDEPVPVLDSSDKGINRWTMNGEKLRGYYPGTADYLAIGVGSEKFAMKKNGEGSDVSIETPNSDFLLDAEQLGSGFSVFQLAFGDKYEGNIFEGKELVAKDLVTGKATEKGYVSLQVKGDETFPDGKPKFLGVDTAKVTIAGAKDVFGASFKADSTYEPSAIHTLGNADFQQFKFTVDLKNDSIAMYVKAAPDVNGESLEEVAGGVRVVYAQTGNKKVLTVSKVKDNGTVEQGALPLITSRQGTPTTLPDGDGVYYLKSVSKGANADKYYVAYNEGKGVFFGGDSVPVLTHPRGQWIVKENNGKYTIVDRESNTALVQNKQIFEVQGMENSYLIGHDTVSVRMVGVDLEDKFIGSFAPTEQDLVDKGYYMNFFLSTPGVSELYMYTNDSILKGSAVDMNLFKLYPVDTTVVAGAKLLGDEISEITYEVGGYFVDGKIAKDGEKGLKFSTSADALRFRFRINPAGLTQYAMMTEEGKYVGIDIHSSNLQLTDQRTEVNFAPKDAPEYASFEAGHKRISVDGNSLVMNPLNRFAQMKAEGSEITKAVYEKDNFSLWVEPDTVVAGKQLYFISSVVDGTRYYLSFKDTTVNGISAEAYKNAMFLPDTIKTVKDSPALFAFKVNEHGGYILENQQQLKGGDYPYVGISGNSVVLERFASVAFEVQTASAPTANEEMNVSEIKVISNDGQVIVTNASGKMITLSNILGQTIGVRRANSEYFSMPATSGIVLVTVEGDTTYKVIVK